MPVDLSMLPFKGEAQLALPPEEMGSLTPPFWVSSTDMMACCGSAKTLKGMIAALLVETFSYQKVNFKKKEYLTFWIL